MVAWREQVRKMRRDVHRAMGVPALFLAQLSARPGVEITVRGPHTKRPMPTGSLVGDAGWAEREDSQPRILFDLTELKAKNLRLVSGTIVSIEAGEAYRVGAVQAPDDTEIYAEVVPLSAAEAAGLPLPGGH